MLASASLDDHGGSILTKFGPGQRGSCPPADRRCGRARAFGTLIVGFVAFLPACSRPSRPPPKAAPPPASIQVHSTPPGAEVRIDGRPTGTTPLALSDLTPGKHFVDLRLDGHLPWEQEVVAEPAESLAVEAALKPHPATLRIESNPEGASVTVDGKPQGNTPWEIGDLAAGRHEILLRHPGYAELQETIEIAPGERVRTRVTLEPDPRRKRILSLLDEAERALEWQRPLSTWSILDDIIAPPPGLLSADETQRLGYLQGRARAAVPAIEFALRFDPEEPPLRDKLGSPTGDPLTIVKGLDSSFAEYAISLRTSERETRHVCLLQFKRAAGTAVRVVPHEVTEEKETIAVAATEAGPAVQEFLDSTRTATEDILYCLVVFDAPPPQGAVGAVLEKAGPETGGQSTLEWARSVTRQIKREIWFQDYGGVLRSLLIRMEAS